jgi:hypothetical protein
MLNLHPLYYHTSLIICQRRTRYPPLRQKEIRHVHLNGVGIMPPEVEVATARYNFC